MHRLEPDPVTLWAEVRPLLNRSAGVLVVDDSTLDKPYARSIELVTRHWSGKHHAVVRGINLVSLVWTNGDRHIPCDYRVYEKADGRTKNDHFADMLRVAYALEASRGQRLHELRFSREGGRLVIAIPQVEDLSLEQLALKQSGSLFEETFGMPVLLRKLR